ncbi:hypothetical protein H5410_004167 [Solanum commersonii]|uniref:Small ribosomal subunit protein bS18c n=1 Tax=Solanum commersonii TaxID=4109 RepID=A0A9J6B766_SOLCO|nr:hypothetical protein H5410_004167 [Solanum commersonii]
MDGKLKEEARYFEFDPDEVEKDDYAYRAEMTFWPGNTCKIKEFASPLKGMIETTTEEVLHKAGFRVGILGSASLRPCMSSKVICICTQISACGDTLQHVYCLFNILASSFSASQIFKKVSLAGQFIGTEYHIPKFIQLNIFAIQNVRVLASFITEAGILLKRSKTGISVKAHRKIAMGIKTARAFGGLMPFTTMGTKHFVFGRTMEDLDADYEYKMYDPNFVNWEPL